MSLIGFFLAATLPLLKSTTDILSKESLDDDVDPVTISLFYRLFGIPIIIVGVFMFGGLPELNKQFFYAISINIPISVCGTFLYIKALEISDLSIVAPFSSISPALLLITGFFILGEIPGIIGIIGIIFLFFGLYIMQVPEDFNSFYEPVFSLVKDKGAILIFIQIILYSIAAPIDKIGVEASSAAFYTLTIYTGFVITFSFIYIVLRRNGNTTSLNKSQKKIIAPIGFLSGLVSLVQMKVITMILVVYVISIKRLGVLISSFYGVVFKDEGYGRNRVLGSVITIFSVIIILIDINLV